MQSSLNDERNLAGELHGELRNDQSARLVVLAREDREFLEAHPFTTLKTTAPRRSRLLRVLLTWGTAPLAAALFVFLLPVFPGEERVKGAEVSLSVYHKTSTGAERLDSSSLLKQGDEIQLAYAAAKKRWVAIYSVDGRGTLTLHWPQEQPEADPVEPGSTELLPFSYRLDDAPAFELFVMISGDHAFAVESLMPEVLAFGRNQSKAWQLPDGLSATTFRVLKKESRP